MAKKLKTFVTSLGFYDQAIAAPSMKAALEAWGANSNLFHQGAASETDDPHIVAATMAAPGVVLKRPVGSKGAFKVHADLPIHVGSDGGRSKKFGGKTGGRPAPKSPKRVADPAADRKAALAFEKEEKRRERDRAKEEATRRRETELRQAAVDRAQRAWNAERAKHEASAAHIRAQIETLEKRLQAEDVRWEKQRSRLEDALRRARATMA